MLTRKSIHKHKDKDKQTAQTEPFYWQLQFDVMCLDLLKSDQIKQGGQRKYTDDKNHSQPPAKQTSSTVRTE